MCSDDDLVSKIKEGQTGREMKHKGHYCHTYELVKDQVYLLLNCRIYKIYFFINSWLTSTSFHVYDGITNSSFSNE